MRVAERSYLALLVALCLTSITLFELSTDQVILAIGLPVVALLLGIGVVSRRFNVADWMVHLWQILALIAIGVGLGLGSNPSDGNYLGQLKELAVNGILTISRSAPPLPADLGVRWFFVLLLGLLAIIADILVVTLASPAWSLAPLLSLYLIPALALLRDVHWYPFALIAVAYLIILASDTDNELGGWTRNLSADTAKQAHSSGGLWRMTAVVGVPLIAASLVVGTLIPTAGSLNIQARRPAGDAPIQLQDPTIELSRNLNNNSTRVVMKYTSSQPGGQYLRLTSLPKMSERGWELVPVNNLGDGTLPPPPGAVSTQNQTTAVQVGDFSSQYLPAPYAPQEVSAAGEWRYDPVSLTMLATGDGSGNATRNLKYSVTSAVVDPQSEAFRRANAGRPSDDATTSQVPAGLPDNIKQLTQTITKGKESDALKAIAIQDYLRDPQNFRYSTKAPTGNGYGVLEKFLFTSKEGYCIHFASSMALMARISGIPSRIAVGFAPGEQQGTTDSWNVLAKNMHAWPELYFAGFGWVRFEPTSAVADAPSWANAAQPNQPSASATPSASSAPLPSTQPSQNPSATPSNLPEEPKASDAEAAFPWGKVLGGVGIGLGVVAIILTPAAVRALSRRRRLQLAGDADERVELLWTELRDSLIDAGREWPEGSPRMKAEALRGSISEAADDSMTRISRLVERSRYAGQPISVSERSLNDVTNFRAELAHRMDGTQQFWAKFWPRSLWRNLWAALTKRGH